MGRACCLNDIEIAYNSGFNYYFRDSKSVIMELLKVIAINELNNGNLFKIDCGDKGSKTFVEFYQYLICPNTNIICKGE